MIARSDGMLGVKYYWVLVSLLILPKDLLYMYICYEFVAANPKKYVWLLSK